MDAREDVVTVGGHVVVGVVLLTLAVAFLLAGVTQAALWLLEQMLGQPAGFAVSR
jgi:hypothetical protein